MTIEFLIFVSSVTSVLIVTSVLLITSKRPLIKVKGGTMKLRRSPYSDAFCIKSTDIYKVITRNGLLIVIRKKSRPIQLPVKNFSNRELDESLEFFTQFSKLDHP